MVNRGMTDTGRPVWAASAEREHERLQREEIERELTVDGPGRVQPALVQERNGMMYHITNQSEPDETDRFRVRCQGEEVQASDFIEAIRRMDVVFAHLSQRA